MIVCWLTLQIFAASPVVNTVFIFTIPLPGQEFSQSQRNPRRDAGNRSEGLWSFRVKWRQLALSSLCPQTPHTPKPLQTASSPGTADITELAN